MGRSVDPRVARLRVGLVGAGPWARAVHAPALAGAVDLAGVWARRAEAAAALVADHGGVAYPSVDALIADVDAVAFAVPPAIQASIAERAARAGRHLVLEKPIAEDLPAALRLAEAAGAAGVRTAVFLTSRYLPGARDFFTRAAAGRWHGGRATWVSGALLAGEFAASPWRHERGALWDVGPHAVDLLDAALGPVARVHSAAGGPADLVHLVLDHESGAIGQVTLSLRVPLVDALSEVVLFGDDGLARFAPTGDAVDAYRLMLAELVAGGAVCDVHQGLRVQRVLRAAADLI